MNTLFPVPPRFAGQLKYDANAVKSQRGDQLVNALESFRKKVETQLAENTVVIYTNLAGEGDRFEIQKGEGQVKPLFESHIQQPGDSVWKDVARMWTGSERLYNWFMFRSALKQARVAEKFI